jgi:hypothetical protein
MQDYGTATFHPEGLVLRRHLARALVLAFAPTDQADPAVTFSDLPPEDPFHRFANVAVKRGWMAAPGGQFLPQATVTKLDLDRSLVRALGLGAEIQGLNAIRTADGAALHHPDGFAELVLALQLGLHYNHPTSAEVRELLPASPVRRSDAAYALWRASSARGTSRITALERFRRVVLPAMTPARRQVTEFVLAYAGYPYLYAGEWHTGRRPGTAVGLNPRWLRLGQHRVPSVRGVAAGRTSLAVYGQGDQEAVDASSEPTNGSDAVRRRRREELEGGRPCRHLSPRGVDDPLVEWPGWCVHRLGPAGVVQGPLRVVAAGSSPRTPSVPARPGPC